MGKNTNVGKIQSSLSSPTPTKYTLEVAVEGTEAKNIWHIWVYPKHTPAQIKEMATGMVMTSDLAEVLAGLDVRQ